MTVKIDPGGSDTSRAGRMPTWILAVACLAWIALVGAGLAKLWAYAGTPGPAALVSERWPAGTSLVRDANRPTLVMFLHPQCACSRATVGELAALMADVNDRVTVHVFMYRPADAPIGWERTDLWASAAAIPGVHVSSDQDAMEAARFGAFVSGQTLLYAADGRIAFSGGITFARGHSGDNEGRSALRSLLTVGTASTRRTRVFGCFIRSVPAV